MKRIAIPVTNKMLCSHFGHCEAFQIYDIDNRSVIRDILVPAPSHKPGLFPKWLGEKNVTEVITGGVGHRAISLFNQQGINVVVGAPLRSPEELIRKYLEGNLRSVDNTCDHLSD